jgi:cytidylate kinase
VTVVTISASYGAGGSRVAPALARRLGVPFLGRPPVPGLLASEDEGGPEERACDEGAGSRPGRLLSRAVSIAVAWGTPAGMTVEELLPDASRRREVEEELVAWARGGAGVVLGRGAAVILRDHPRALHALLDGPAEARVEQAMAIEGIDRATAERRRARVDRFRHAYMEDLYGFEAHAPGSFDVVLDSTALKLDDCVEILAVAAARRGGA